ncbi:MAG: hypothetical protein RBS57_05110 [Desulforhabdus sp.]|jgi:hypothetical protein|nr:hypothetical protein [Desulforhabdus sp.]
MDFQAVLERNIDQAVKAIVAVEAGKRDRWISAFLAGIEDYLGEDGLKTIQRLIEQRLKNGMW